jgi:hypothetical protein
MRNKSLLSVTSEPWIRIQTVGYKEYLLRPFYRYATSESGAEAPENRKRKLVVRERAGAGLAQSLEYT